MHDNRKRLYTLLQVANRELTHARAGWCDDDYRAILQQCGATEKSGKFSASTMTNPQIEQALERFKQLGFKPRRSQTKTAPWRMPRIAKLNAMWCALADAKVVDDRSETAMKAWCKHQVKGLNNLEWATSEQLNKAVEMLKQFCRSREVEVK